MENNINDLDVNGAHHPPLSDRANLNVYQFLKSSSVQPSGPALASIFQHSLLLAPRWPSEGVTPDGNRSQNI